MDGGYWPGQAWAPRRILQSAILLLAVLTLPLSAISAANTDSDARLNHQRSLYQSASRALARGDSATFTGIRQQLQGYALLPYLDFEDISSRLQRVDSGEIDRFLADNNDSVLNAWLRERWLQHLAARQRWGEFIRYYDGKLKSTDLACHHAYAQYVQGDRSRGISAGQALWQVGESRPKSCDPIFERLVAGGHIDDNLAWQRYIAAVLNHEYTLATYVSRFFTREETRRKAALYLEADQKPRLLANTERFTAQTPEESRIIQHGLTHLARIDAPLALSLWQRYQQSHDFGPDDEKAINGALVRALFQAGHRASADQYLFQVQDKLSPDTLAWRLREMVVKADWPGIINLSSQLAENNRSDSRWKYWRARALALSGNQSPETTRQLYTEVSAERSFYGFLASEWLQTPYQMQHEPVDIPPAELEALAATPTFQRIAELYYHRQLIWARREWYSYLNGQDARRWIAAAKLAQQWGWHNQAIMSMIQANYWNDIDVRFPVAFRDEFLRQAQATSIPVNLLLALSRQESAFNDTVTSPSGAKGLMQLMPTTALETARKHGIPYSGVGDLDKPDKNILIGSRYYRQMLQRFNNNRILATAAYNAGPGRVAIWRQSTGGRLPFDAWIEAIPFTETRGYVQNVLAFSMIYAHHLGLDTAILSDSEKNTRL